ncbi:MAG: hypothetical protein JW819_03320 [Candidatus Krumholzibacteriota bacterium]|nr:hypothetical protein [Candidatus Krumholzibacteriota bacterium]
MRASVAAAGLFLCLLVPAPGRGEAPLRPGLFLDYRLEVLSEGQRSEDRLRLEVGEQAVPGCWRITLRLGDGEDAARYRALYDETASGDPFADARFDSVAEWREGGWRPLAAGDLAVIDALREVHGRLAGRGAEAESVFVVAGRELAACRVAFADTTESVQAGETVTLRTVTVRRGEVWTSGEVPFGGWLRYREERRARKVSELGGRRFEGAEETTVETWVLADARLGGMAPR